MAAFSVIPSDLAVVGEIQEASISCFDSMVELAYLVYDLSCAFLKNYFPTYFQTTPLQDRRLEIRAFYEAFDAVDVMETDLQIQFDFLEKVDQEGIEEVFRSHVIPVHLGLNVIPDACFDAGRLSLFKQAVHLYLIRLIT